MLKKLAHILTLSRQRAAEGHLSVQEQLVEMARLRIGRGVGPRYYHTAGFWRREVPWRDKRDHLSAAEHERVVDTLSPPRYQKLSQNKFAEKALLSLYGLPTARFFGRLQHDDGVDYRSRPLTDAESLARLVAEHELRHLVFKEPEGHGGFGIHIIEFDNDTDAVRPLAATQTLSLADYCERTLRLSSGYEWLVEDYLPQHPTMMALNPTSLNGMRIWVRRHPNGVGELITAYARIGRAGMIVDEATSGGMIAPLDLDTGVLRAARDAFAERRLYPQHPDSGVQIEGVQVPQWPQARSLAERALNVFPMLNFAGMDIAISADGPVIVELNVSPDREAAAYTGCPTRRFFKDLI